MEIAFLSFYSGINYRGVETYVHQLGNELINLGHNVTVYQSGPKFSSALYSTQTLKSINALPSFTQKPKILISTNGRVQSVVSRIWCLANDAKHIIPGQSGPGRDDIINLYTFPHTFVALTNFQKTWANKHNPFVKTVVIPNGVDFARFKTNKKRPPKSFLSVAALMPEKRLHLAIQAVAAIPNGELTLVGSGPEKQNLLDLGTKLMPGRLVIKTVHPQDMPSVYTSASTFIYPTSNYESFGIVLLEAMAANIPIVATQDPIRKEIIGHAGLLIDPVNTPQFTQALIDAEDKKWGMLPRTQAEKFSWTRIASLYDQLFNQLK